MRQAGAATRQRRLDTVREHHMNTVREHQSNTVREHQSNTVREHQSNTVREHQMAQRRVGAPVRGRTIRTTTIRGRPSAVDDAAIPTVTSLRRGRPSRLAGTRTDFLALVLIAGDTLAVLFGFYMVLFSVSSIGPRSWSELLAQMIAVTTVGMVAIRSQRLWVARLNGVRAIELSRLTRAVGLMGLGTIVLDRGLHLYFHVADIAIGCVVVWVVLVTWRSIYRQWVGAQRKAGRHMRRVIVVGTDRRAMSLVDIFATYPEQGVEVVGLIGSAREAREAGRRELWRGNYADAPAVLARAHVDGVVLCSSDINTPLLDVLLRGEQARDRDLFLDPGVSGIDFRRVQPLPIAHEPLLYVASPTLAPVQVWFKRAFDIAVAAMMLIVLSPLLVAVAVAVKLTDRGPVLFRQVRVGRGGDEFAMLKFRSMRVTAEAELAALRDEHNERSGPLFKLADDPRVTRVGRIIRAVSIDELPQLWNVLRGDMSLVGPRPALPSEVAEFPDELRARHAVRPGITGLWQIEARDNPSFDAYRRLDLFYVDNWSLLLDLVILLGTIDHVLVRPFLSERTGRTAPDAHPAPELEIRTA
jgi:exopolysaccharide biosynthesis polyprenyl glycosylphosphotransferase